MNLVELHDDMILKIYGLMGPCTSVSTYAGLHACRRLIEVVKQPLKKHLMMRMGTTRLAVGKSEKLEWSASGLTGDDCVVGAECIKSNLMPMLNKVDFGNNNIGDIGAIGLRPSAAL